MYEYKLSCAIRFTTTKIKELEIIVVYTAE